MKMQAKARVMALVMALAMALVMVQGAAAQTTPGSFPQVKTPDSAKFDLTGSISSGGETIPISGSGAFGPGQFMMDLTLTAPAGATSGPEAITLSAIVLGDKLYFKLGGLGLGEDEDKWYVSDLDDVTGGATGMMPGMPGSMADLQAVLEALTITEVGKETINGAATTQYRIDVDLEKLNEFASSASGTPPTEVPEGTSLVFNVWVGDQDMYVHRVSMNFDTVVAAGEQEDDLSFDLTLTFKEFNAPVNIVAPPNAEPIDLGPALGGVIPGMPSVIGVMPGMPGSSMAGMPRTGAAEQSNNLPLALAVVALASIALGSVARRRAVLAK
ncbi:MAG TPA: hypothetical protein VGE45_08210 [Chloroflexia bacterium]